MVSRIITCIAAGLFMGTAAVSAELQPAELPPDDFTARQYIDSNGCVFLRGEDQQWRARMYRGEGQACGFPPTLAKRPIAIEGAVALDLPAEPSLEQVLTDAVFPYLREGERVGDRTPFQPLPDMGPEPALTGPADFIQAEVAAQTAIRYSMAGARQPNRELCRLLGYDGAVGLGQTTGTEGLGSDPTQGFCYGLAASKVPWLVFARPAKLPEEAMPEDPKRHADRIAPEADRDKPVPKAEVATGPDKPRRNSNASRPQADGAEPKRPDGRAAKTTSDEAMIPAHARYVQVGVFDGPDQIADAARRLQSLGLPVVRQVAPLAQGGQVILAGPFTSRQAIVMALNRIRSAGFPQAVPR